MTYRHKNRCRHNGICPNYQRHEYSLEQRLKQKFKFNFQTMNKTMFQKNNTKTKNMIRL
jgi:hypothetical protein